MSLSVLLSVYHGTRADELEKCLESLAEQSYRPSEVMLVLDGPVSAEVRRCLDSMRGRLPIEVLECSENRGLGLALRDGLEACENDLIARMDTDDVSRSHRFKEQVEFLEARPEISMVGGILREHYSMGTSTLTVDRNVPKSSTEVQRFAKFRNPINHPTVMFRKRDVIEVGSYQHFPLMEDYHLVVRLIVNSKAIVNLDRVFVEANPDGAFFRRRGGLAYLKQELSLSAFFRSVGFHNWAESISFCLMRTPYRLMPGAVREGMYRLLLRSRLNRETAHV